MLVTMTSTGCDFDRLRLRQAATSAGFDFDRLQADRQIRVFS